MPTQAQVQAAKDAYYDNADFEEVASASKAKAFVTACRRLIAVLPRSTSKDGAGAVSLSPELVQQELERAQRWLTLHGDTNSVAASGGVKHLSFRSYPRW